MEKKTDILQDGIDSLISYFTDKPNITGMLTAFLNQVQEIEDAAYSVYEARNVFQATGDHLDKFGELVGESRQGREDSDYRKAILARIAINTSEGTPEEVISVFNILTDSTNTIFLEQGTANVSITGNTTIENAELIKTLIKKVLPAGVSLEYVGFAAENEGPWFAFFGTDSDDLAGFGDPDDATVGGKFIDGVV